MGFSRISRTTAAVAVAFTGMAAVAQDATAQQQQQQQQQQQGPIAFPDASAADMRVLGTLDPNVRKATALVNGDIITDTDIEQRLNLVLAANGGKVGEEEKQRLRLQVLRNLIDEKLQIQEAAAHDVKIDEQELETAYKRVSTNFRQANGKFEEFLRAAGSSPASIRQQIRGELAWNRLLRKRVEPFVNVGDDEVQQVIAKLQASKGQPEYRVGEIFLSATPETQDRVTADAQRIVQQVRGGASFVAYARQFSEASTAAVGGDLGWVKTGQLRAALQPVIPALRAGQVSDPVPVPGGIAIVALIDKRQVLAADPNDAVLSLKQISVPFPPNVTQAQANTVVKAMQARTQTMGGCGRAEAVAKELGGEINSNDQIRIKDLPPALQDMVKTMQIGGTTPPFGSSKDGVRVLVLCGRDDAPSEVKPPSFDEVYAQMNDERVNLAARRYLRDLRRDAVIDYR